MGKNKYGDLEEQEFQNALDTQAGKEKTEVTDLGDNFEVLFVDSNRYYEVDANGNIQDFELGASDSYPGDITKDENGNYPADWNKWKIGENGYPTFVKESNN